jgi:hypothetical protein
MIVRGLFAATLLFPPALYVAWSRVKEPRKEREVGLRQDVPALAK